jgi:hypothetical protein
MYAFSFCLYNAYDPFYYVGLLENIKLIHRHFPGWLIYVYIGNDVPNWFREKLASLGCRLRETNESGAINMVYRFFAIDEPDVDIMFSRDADSRVHWKDRWAIQEFIKSDKMVHTIRDNKVHTAPILGGLFGIRKPNFSIRELHDSNRTGYQVNLGYDQNFLANTVYAIYYKTSILIHSSIDWKFVPEEVLTPFPFQWSPVLWCGRPELIGYIEPGVRFSVVSYLNKNNGH